MALPPVLAGRMIYEPAMPPLRDYLTQRMPIRGKYAVAALYDAPFWIDGSGSGTVASTGHDAASASAASARSSV